MVVVKVVDAAQNPLALLKDAGKGIELSEEAAATLKRGLDDAEAARGISHGADDAERGIEQGAEKTARKPKPKMTSEATSLEGITLEMEFMRDLSPTARALVRKMEKRGWVRVNEIAKDDLVAISKWFDREIGVVQSPYGKLRIVLGTRDGVLDRGIRKGRPHRRTQQHHH